MYKQMQECIFCKIINKEINSEIVYEDDDFISFKDIKPEAPFHVLIVPKKHIAWLNDLNEEDIEFAGKMLLLAKKIAKDNGVGQAYKIKINIGKEAGQEIFHLHMHLIGGFS